MYFSNTSFEFVGGNVKALFLKGLLCLAVNQPLFVSYPNWTITPLQLNAVLKLDSKGLGSLHKTAWMSYSLQSNTDIAFCL